MGQTTTDLPPHLHLLDQSMTYLYSAALGAAAQLGIADALADGPKPPDAIARAVGASPLAVHRLLRYLATRGIFREDEQGNFHLTPPAEPLRSDIPSSLRDAVLMLTHKVFWLPAGELSAAVREGNTPFERILGMPFFDYLTRDPADGKIFHVGMASFSDSENSPIAQCYDFSPFQRIVDVGGGHGGFLVEILREHSSARGVLFDHANVLEQHRLAAEGVLDRCEIVAGDFFDAVPSGADAYVLKRILHDWDDPTSVRILHNCRRALPEGGRVLVIDAVIPPGNDPHPGKTLDVLMMASLPGRERSEADFSRMFAEAGLRLTRVIPTPSALSIVEAVAA